VRLLVHRTAPVEGQGTPGHVLEAAADRLIVAAGRGAVRLLQIQLSGKKPMPVAEFLRGHHVFPGDKMGGDFLGTGFPKG
jgi:methionyl-tRNA formyltransferase